MKLGYIRVSTVEQNSERQEVTMTRLGVERMYIDRLTGANADRPELQAMLNYARAGDTVIVDDISRLARNTLDLLTIVKKLNDQGVDFVSLKENIDTKSPNGRFFLQILGAVYELELATNHIRQREGIEIAKAAGKYKGRAPIYPNKELLEVVHTDWVEGKISGRQAMRNLNVGHTTFYKLMRNYEIAIKGMDNVRLKLIEQPRPQEAVQPNPTF